MLTPSKTDQLQALLDAIDGDFRALSIWPEWIYAFCFLQKRIENRGPKVAREARDMVGRWHALHGSKGIGGIPPNAKGQWNYRHADAIDEMIAVAKLAGVDPGTFPLRNILDCRGVRAFGYLAEVLPPPKQRNGYHMPDCYGLHFSEIIVLPSAVPAKGALGFWRVPDDVKPDLRRQLLAKKPAPQESTC